MSAQEAAAHSKEAADAASSRAEQLAAELAAGRRDDAAMLEELVCAKLNLAQLQVSVTPTTQLHVSVCLCAQAALVCLHMPLW